MSDSGCCRIVQILPDYPVCRISGTALIAMRNFLAISPCDHAVRCALLVSDYDDNDYDDCGGVYVDYCDDCGGDYDDDCGDYGGDHDED